MPQACSNRLMAVRRSRRKPGDGSGVTAGSRSTTARGAAVASGCGRAVAVAGTVSVPLVVGGALAASRFSPACDVAAAGVVGGGTSTGIAAVSISAAASRGASEAGCERVAAPAGALVVVSGGGLVFLFTTISRASGASGQYIFQARITPPAAAVSASTASQPGPVERLLRSRRFLSPANSRAALVMIRLPTTCR